MVTICAKKFCKPTIQDIMLSRIRKKKENEDIEEFFQRLKQQRQQTSSRVLSGTTVPNSTFKNICTKAENEQDKEDSRLCINNNIDIGSDKVKSSSSITTKNSLALSLDSLKRSVQEKEASSAVLLKPEERSQTSSLLSGTGTLEELKELRDLLHKSSYVPKQTRTRRPTIEKIKSAIKKEKYTLNDKNESTINDSIESSDASTSTEKKKSNRVKSRKKISNSLNRSNINTSKTINTGSSTIQGDKKRTKIKKKKKIRSKIDVEVQCSIFKVKLTDENNSGHSALPN